MHWKWKGNGSIFGQAKDVNKSSAKGRCRKERGAHNCKLLQLN